MNNKKTNISHKRAPLVISRYTTTGIVCPVCSGCVSKEWPALRGHLRSHKNKAEITQEQYDEMIQKLCWRSPGNF